MASVGGARRPRNAVRGASCAVAILLLLACAAAAFGEPPAVSSDAAGPSRQEEDPGNALSARSFSVSPGRTLLLSPVTDLYPRSIADPRRPGLGIMYLRVPASQIPDAGANRAGIRMGGSYGLVRIHRDDDPARGYQLDVMANFIGQFDLDHALDNIGWDGLYGLAFTWGKGQGLAFKFGVFHDSSHVGR